jgi:hypothetical protein
MSEHFAVWIFFKDGYHFKEGEDLTDLEACKLARSCTLRPAAQIGVIDRVIITDPDDYCAFEWIYGRGVTFPIIGKN